MQPELLKGEIEHSVVNKSNFAGLRHIWEPYLKLDVLCLAFIYARHSMEMQNMSGFGIKDFNRGYSRIEVLLERMIKIQNFIRLTINTYVISYADRSREVEWMLLIDILNRVSVKKY